MYKKNTIKNPSLIRVNYSISSINVSMDHLYLFFRKLCVNKKLRAVAITTILSGSN